MQVAISVFGRFHAFYLAQQLQKRDALAQLITSYPTFEVSHYGIAKKRIASFLPLEAVRRLSSRWPSMARAVWNPQLSGNWLFDRWAASQLQKGSEVFVGWSGNSLASLKRARELGMVTIVERGSSHMKYQTELLVEEYARYGLKFRATHPVMIDREIEEYELADFISVPSTFAKRSFLECGTREDKIIQVPLGVNLAEFNRVPKHDDKFRFLFCGSLDLQKGIPYLLEAFHKMKLRDAELSLVGPISAEIEPVLTKFTKLNSNIVVHGPKKQSELSNYYSQASVFCLPSIQDGFGMVVPQAMSCGLPVICTENTVGEDLVRNGMEGFVIPIRNIERLQEKMFWCFEHPDQCYAMGQAARERIRSGFTWDDYGQKIYFEYCRAFEKKGLRKSA